MLIAAIVIGVINACLAIALDFAMNYGHLLWQIRFDAVRKTAAKAGSITVESEGKTKEVNILESFDQDADKGRNIGFGERVGYFDQLYWWVATFDNKIVWLLCVKCLSYRIFVLTFIASIVGFGLGWLEALQLLFIGSSANLIAIMVLTTTTTGKGE